MKKQKSSFVELFTKRVKNYLSDDFVILDVDSSIGEGLDKAQKLKKSTVLIIEHNKLIGIITEQDIFRRVLFKSNRKDLLKNFMTSPVIFVYEEDLLFHAVGEMRKSKLRHLPVVNLNEEIIGILNLHQALSAELGVSMEIIDSITFSKDEEGINSLKAKQASLAEGMMKEHVDPEDITYILSSLNNVVYRRSIRIAIDKTQKKNILEKIPEFCVLAMGSAGRMESFLYPDQDNGLIYNLDKNDDPKKVDMYFKVMAKEFTKILDTAGIPFCKGDMMASNSLWRNSLQEWKNQFDQWVDVSDDLTLRYIDMLYDFRPVYGNPELAKEFRTHILKKLERTPSFLKYLYRRDSETNAGIGLFGQFILEKKDKNNLGLLNLKHTGTLPLVEATRMYSIKHKLREVSTLERLKKLTELKIFNKDEFDFFKNAHRFISNILLKNQIESAKTNKKIKNYINPKKLLNREKKLLKIYFKEIRKLRAKVKMDFSGTVVHI